MSVRGRDVVYAESYEDSKDIFLRVIGKDESSMVTIEETSVPFFPLSRTKNPHIIKGMDSGNAPPP